ncbi:protein kinase [Streptomyces sp. NPDC091212]|uniref:serine/threonine-protein kinase n=1 Tax=Streptomyces sp. NPDC091212 TaxID=3155191 RepID=UPI00342CB94E
MKKLHRRYPGEHPTARMKREIEIARHLDGHPHAMPVLDSAANCTWFVMPWAEATAEHRREELQQPGQLRALVDAIASVLAAVPEAGWIHRDIKPSNILLLDGRWTLADWGIGRRPPGQTTKIGRTGLALGTEGFAAPELSEDAHGATVASDIYSIGRVIAWALTGQIPKANLDLFPPPGPWRNIVKATTKHNPQHRPQTIDDLLALITREHIDHPEDPIGQANVLLEAAHGGKLEAAEGLLLLVDNHDQDYELHINVLTGLAIAQAAPILARELPLSRRLLRAFAEHVDGDETHRVQFGEAAGAIEWLHGVAVWAADRQQWDLLEEAAGAMCEWDGAWDQYRPQDKIRPWLQALTGEAAVTVAAVLREHPNSAKHFSGLAKNRAVDVRVRNAVTEQSFASRKPARQKEPLSLATAGSGARPDITLAPADVRKAEVLSKAVQRGAEWLYQFRTQPTFHKIRDSVQDPLYAAQAVLHRDDPATFDDLTLRRLFDGFRQYLDTFCDHLADMDPQAGFSQIPVEWRTSDRDRYRETNEVLKRTRDEFIAAYDALFEQLVRKGFAS